MTQTPVAPAPPAPPPPKPEPSNSGLVVAIAILGLVISMVSWWKTKSSVEELSRQVTELQDSQEKLGAALRKAGGGTAAAAAPTAVGTTVDMKGVPARGAATAVVTLIEVSDYECPFCLRHFQQTMPKIDANYIQNGKIRYIFRDFPVDSLHPQSIKAHEAAHCAIEQNRFWELHNLLFAPGGQHTPQLLDSRANAAGLNLPAFDACIASGRTTAAIRAAETSIAGLGVDGTPTFFLGTRDVATDQVKIGAVIVGAQPYEDFAKTLDGLLAKK